MRTVRSVPREEVHSGLVLEHGCGYLLLVVPSVSSSPTVLFLLQEVECLGAISDLVILFLKWLLTREPINLSLRD